MSQINKFSVREIGEEPVSELNSKDQALVSDYLLENIPFILGKYQLDALFYTLDGIFLEAKQDILSYSVLGTNQGNSAVEISVNPIQDALDNGYLGDIQVGYRVTNNLFSPSHSLDSKAILYIQEISTDRTEIRAASLGLSEEDLQSFAQDLQSRFTAGPYFTGATLSFLDERLTAWCVNVMTEVLDGRLVVTFKLYEPLSTSLGVKSRFFVLEQIGTLKKFEVLRSVEVLEDDLQPLTLKGPNFDVETKTSSNGTITDYLNYKQLFSYPSRSNNIGLYSIYKDKGIEIGVDHSNFSNFIHFSSAAERLENFRYKLGLIQEYEQEVEVSDQEPEKLRIKKLIQGIIGNFDHYDRYLYFENTETAWPKVTVDRPYKNASLSEAEEWFENMLQKAQEYDENNSDKLIDTVPQAIRSNSQNEPYLVFVDMIGQHFDEEWLYAKAVSSRFDGDNRLNFGIPKDLVQEALRSFGIELQTTNQNLERIFDACIPGEYYHKGSELTVKYFERATANNVLSGGTVLPVSGTLYDGEYSTRTGQVSGTTIDGEYAPRTGGSDEIIDAGTSGRVEDITEFQPMYVEDYRKEIYKRIYHNVPLLLKTKGTSRSIRALISCFGIPENVLDIEVRGGTTYAGDLFFGPEEYTTSSIDRVRVDEQTLNAPLLFDQSTGQFVSGTVLSDSRTVQQTGTNHLKGTNSVSVGFNLNKQINSQIKDYLSSLGNFNYDNLIGDPRNTEENYGEVFSLLRNQILPELWDPQGKLQIRSPYAVLRLVRYIDSVLFRTLNNFVAARDEISVGAIVNDNILHRNRYKGVAPEAEDVSELSDNIQTVFIDGGEGGSLKVLRGGRPANKPVLSQSFEIKATVARNVVEYRELPTVNYEEKDAISIGTGYQSAIVFDDSPKFNGELLGTVSEITNGELNEGNKFKKGGSSVEQLTYQVDFRFLCLPAIPVDTVIQAYGSLLGNQFIVSLEESPDLVSIFVDSVRLSRLDNVIASLNNEVLFLLDCPWKDQQGWLFSEEPVDNLNCNYIGVDMHPDTSIGQDLEIEMSRISGQRTILLPGNREVVQMAGTFGERDQGSTTMFWEKTVTTRGFRYILARYLSSDRAGSLKTLEMSLEGSMNWPSLEGGTQPLSAISRCYSLTTEEGENQFLNDLNILYGPHKLYKIYAVVLNAEGNYQLIVLDLETGEYRDWDDSVDTDIWTTLRGYPDGWNSKTYVMSRYLQGVSPRNNIVGIVLGDEETGIGGESGPRVLMEPYMGIPYVFVKGSNDSALFQLKISEWRPE